MASTRRVYARRRELREIRNPIVVRPDDAGLPQDNLVANRTSDSGAEGRFAMNVGLIITFAIVLAGLGFILYGLIRPFTHVHHDHRDVFHPPHLD